MNIIFYITIERISSLFLTNKNDNFLKLLLKRTEFHNCKTNKCSALQLCNLNFFLKLESFNLKTY